MQQTAFKYPIFEANQVLTNTHLNEVFEYLEEQGRLTRANLIGIGIVCGLEISLDAATVAVQLTRGCGVTSEGYLIIEPEDVLLTTFREYTVPDEMDYLPFKDGGAQYPLWELFPAGTPSTTSLNAEFLSDKAVLLFLELKKDGLRNCSPNDCNDKGAEMTATVRRLLITVSDLDKIIAAANGLGNNLTTADLEAELMARLNLPDLRLPRYDVPNTGLVTSNQVWRAFFEVFQRESLAANTGNALTAAYQAFRPILQDHFPIDPFADFSAVYGFLNDAPQNDAQVRFLQYYYDLFDDLLKAYDEFRAQGVELLCACCPSEELFPRHLMLGALMPASSVNPAIYRHHFITSAAVGNCGQRTVGVQQLFRRLVEMTLRFSNTPPLTAPVAGVKHDSQIKITPSKLGDVPVSEKAIPYYYLQNGVPALYQLWNPAKTRINRANQNLSYRSDEYVPSAPVFITQPLRYDLEPNNFLRIEGHLGKDYRSVLETLLLHKSTHRLPIDIIALRTGEYNENAPLDLTREGCWFQDLEAIYDVHKAELLCAFCKALEYFYSLPDVEASNSEISFAATVPLLNLCAPGLMVQPRTMGSSFDPLWTRGYATAPYYSPTQEPNSIVSQLSSMAPNYSNFIFIYIMYYLAKFTEVVKDDLRDFDLASFEVRVRDITVIAGLIERNKEAYQQGLGAQGNIPLWEEIDDWLDTLSKACHLDTFQTLHAEYIRRAQELRRKQYLSHFLEQHPGIQHKAGVPLGGTFVIVYDYAHWEGGSSSDIDIRYLPSNGQIFGIRGRVTDENGEPLIGVTVLIGGTTTGAITDFDGGFSLSYQGSPSPSTLVIGYSGYVNQETPIAYRSGYYIWVAVRMSMAGGASPSPTVTPVDRAIAAAVGQLSPGTVIADFFLPYLCCSDCAPVQFVLAAEQPERPRELETCEYRWASRDSHLRGLEGDYVFTILEYTINGTDVVTAPHAIEIQNATIRSEGLQAVAHALNALGGLVFGVGTMYSYLSIQRFSDHEFILVIQEEGESNIFTYTHNEVLFNGDTYIYGQKINCTNSPVTDDPQPCTLPCDGVVRTCKYELQELGDITVVSVVSLITIDENGNRAEIQKALDETSYNSDNRPDLFLFNYSAINFGELINVVNQIYTAEALAPSALSFQHEGEEQAGSLVVSRYVCHDFELTLEFDRGVSMVITGKRSILASDGTTTNETLVSDCTNENRCP